MPFFANFFVGNILKIITSVPVCFVSFNHLILGIRITTDADAVHAKKCKLSTRQSYDRELQRHRCKHIHHHE
jgi:hypothetical protein